MSADISPNPEVGPVDGWRSSLVGASPAMRKIAELIELIAPRRSTVLITGETGSGKEVVAKALHRASLRRHHPFVGVNCAAIPRDRLDAELFGREESGACLQIGRFEQAQKGTLFLDEVADLGLDLQGKLLRVLQEREFQRPGGTETVALDVRVVAATNVDLFARMKQGAFREDFYYRLQVVPLHVPPLRDRKEDIPLLLRYFMERIAVREGIPAKCIPPPSLRPLLSFDWPGNVRQLENTLEMAVVLSGERTELEPDDFSLPVSPPPLRMTADNRIALPEEGLDFEQAIRRIELDLLSQALVRSQGNKSAAAALLKLKRTTLNAKLKTLEESAPELLSALYEGLS